MVAFSQIEDILKPAESFFDTADDPDQMPIGRESFDLLMSIHPETIKVKTDDSGKAVSLTVAVPTSKETMNLFLSGDITERELLYKAAREKSFEALYLCFAFTLPEYRGKGYIKDLALDIIDKLAADRSVELYGWPFSKEGQSLFGMIQSELGREIKMKK